MTTDAFTNRLSDYLDGEIDARERAVVGAHLAECTACQRTLDDLRTVVARAAAVEDAAPARDLWDGIARQIAPPAQRAARDSWFHRLVSSRRFSFSLPQLAAASLALVLLSGGVVWMARSGDPRADFEPVSAHNDASAIFVDTHYDEAVADLERTLDAGRPKLDPQIVRVLEENLAAIDRAIDQCRRALSADPANVYLNRHLADTRQRKLSLLRRASALAQPPRQELRDERK